MRYRMENSVLKTPLDVIGSFGGVFYEVLLSNFRK